MLTETAIRAMREDLMHSIAYARYKAGDTYYQAAIQNAEILESDVISVSFFIDTDVTGGNTVTEVQLYSHSGALWVSKAVNILRTEAQEVILFRFSLSVSEI